MAKLKQVLHIPKRVMSIPRTRRSIRANSQTLTLSLAAHPPRQRSQRSLRRRCTMNTRRLSSKSNWKESRRQRWLRLWRKSSNRRSRRERTTTSKRSENWTSRSQPMMWKKKIEMMKSLERSKRNLKKRLPSRLSKPKMTSSARTLLNLDSFRQDSGTKKTLSTRSLLTSRASSKWSRRALTPDKTSREILTNISRSLT